MTSAYIKILLREFNRIFERKTLYLISIILPIIIFLTYGFIYKQEIIREIPVSIYDNDNSSLSQKIIEQVESSSSLRIVKYNFNLEEVKNDFKSGSIHGAFYIPKGFEKNIKMNKNSTIVVYINSSNLIFNNIILKDATTIIKTVSASILLKKIRSKGNSFNKSFDIINPVRIETASLYNYNYSYLNYLVPGLIGFTLQMMIMISSVLVFSSEFSHGSFNELVRISKFSSFNIIIGKLTSHFLIHITNILLILFIIFPFFNIHVKGAYTNLFFIYIIFVLTNLLIAFAVSSLIKDQQLATEVVVFFNTPAFIFSGFTFPLWAMPNIHASIAYTMPFTYFINSSIKIMYMNCSLSYIKNEILIFSALIMISLVITFLSISYKIKNSNKDLD